MNCLCFSKKDNNRLNPIDMELCEEYENEYRWRCERCGRVKYTYSPAIPKCDCFFACKNKRFKIIMKSDMERVQMIKKRKQEVMEILNENKRNG